MRPVQQQRVCYLETAGEDYVLDMVRDGMYLSQIGEKLDPENRIGISKSVLSLWLSGKYKRNISWTFDLTDDEGNVIGTEVRPAETPAQVAERGRKYAEAKVQWADSIVENAGRKLMDENDGKLALLRKAQGEFAFRIAGIFDKRYADQKANNIIAVQVNLTGEDHLNALRRRQVKVSQVGDPLSVISLPASTVQYLEAESTR
jgi:hypothetical protein